jgi:hypothetical protein
VFPPLLSLLFLPPNARDLRLHAEDGTAKRVIEPELPRLPEVGTQVLLIRGGRNRRNTQSRGWSMSLAAVPGIPWGRWVKTTTHSAVPLQQVLREVSYVRGVLVECM